MTTIQHQPGVHEVHSHEQSSMQQMHSSQQPDGMCSLSREIRHKKRRGEHQKEGLSTLTSLAWQKSLVRWYASLEANRNHSQRSGVSIS